MMVLLSEMLRRQIVIVKAENSGAETNGSMIKLLRKGDIQITSPLVLSDNQLEQGFTGTPPIESERCACVMQVPKNTLPTALNPMQSKEVQKTFVVILATILMLRSYNRLIKSKNWLYPGMSFFYNGSSLCFWLLVTLVLELFSSQLSIDMFRPPDLDLPFETFQEFLQKVVDKEVVALTLKNTLQDSILAIALCKFVGKENGCKETKLIQMIEDHEDGMERVKKDSRVALFVIPPYDQFIVNSNCINGQSRFVSISHETFPTVHRGLIIFGDNRRVAEQLNYTTLAILGKHRDRFLTKMLQNERRESGCNPPVRMFHAMNLATAKNLFHALWGLAVAFFIWICQHIHVRWGISVDKVPLLRSMVNESNESNTVDIATTSYDTKNVPVEELPPLFAPRYTYSNFYNPHHIRQDFKERL